MQGICLPEEPASKKKEKAGEFLKKAKAAAKAKAKAAAETASKATAAEEAKRLRRFLRSLWNLKQRCHLAQQN